MKYVIDYSNYTESGLLNEKWNTKYSLFDDLMQLYKYFQNGKGSDLTYLQHGDDPEEMGKNYNEWLKKRYGEVKDGKFRWKGDFEVKSDELDAFLSGRSKDAMGRNFNDLIRIGLASHERDSGRKQTLKVMQIISGILIIISAFGGALFSVRGIMITRMKRKNKKETGSDRLTQEQEDKMYKLYILSKIMVIMGAFGGALRVVKFILSGYWGDSWVDDGGIMSANTMQRDTMDTDIGTVSASNDVSMFINKINENDGDEVQKLLLTVLKNNPNIVNGIVEKVGKFAKKLPSVLQRLFKKRNEPDEDLIIECAKINQVVERNIGKGEITKLVKLGEKMKDAIGKTSIRENWLMEANIEKLVVTSSREVDPTTIDSILSKVWNTKMEQDCNVIEKTKDISEALIKTMEIKKTLNTKLNQSEKDLLVSLGMKLG